MSDPFNRPPAERFAGILRGLYEALAAQGRRGTLTGWLLILVCTRLNRAGQGVMAIAARLAAGTLRPPRQALPRQASPRLGPSCTAPRQAPPTAAGTPAVPPKLRLPAGFGWLIQRLQPVEVARRAVAAHGAQMQYLLAEPDMVAMITAAPQVGRHIRPICRLLGVPLPPVLQRPRRPRPPKAPAPTPALPKRTVPRPPRGRRLRTMDDYGPPSRPGWERPVRLHLPPCRPAATKQPT